MMIKLERTLSDRPIRTGVEAVKTITLGGLDYIT